MRTVAFELSNTPHTNILSSAQKSFRLSGHSLIGLLTITYYYRRKELKETMIGKQNQLKRSGKREGNKNEEKGRPNK